MNVLADVFCDQYELGKRLLPIRVISPWDETNNPVDKRRKNPRKTCKRLVVNRVAVLVSTLFVVRFRIV